MKSTSNATTENLSDRQFQIPLNFNVAWGCIMPVFTCVPVALWSTVPGELGPLFFMAIITSVLLIMVVNKYLDSRDPVTGSEAPRHWIFAIRPFDVVIAVFGIVIMGAPVFALLTGDGSRVPVGIQFFTAVLLIVLVGFNNVYHVRRLRREIEADIRLKRQTCVLCGKA